MHFGQAPRFEILDDGSVLSRAGTQTNCGGIAKIHVRITAVPDRDLTLLPEHDPNWQGEHYGRAVPGAAMPREYQEAAFRGAAAAFEKSHLSFGVQYELLDALVHDVDAQTNKFYEAGYAALAGWIKHFHPEFWPG